MTSTYFEGQAKANPQAKRGYSRDKRGDCKQVVVGLVLDRDGFPKAAAAPPSRLLTLDPASLWFSASGSVAPAPVPPRRKVEPADVQRALKTAGSPSAFNPLRQQIIQNSKCSKRTADLAIRRAREQGFIVHDGAQYCLPL